MTDGERISAALVISLTLHWLVLGAFTQPKAATTILNADDIVITDIAGPDVGISLAAPITLEQLAPSLPQDAASPEAAAAERRREALSRYLDQISTSIHARRKISGKGRALVGNAVVKLTIDGSGQFSGAALVRSSGDSELDADAVQAVESASGTVSRPKILGTAALTLTIAVKYQFGL